ncbi:hypothetical protein EIP91_000946 [Steccherinum ochraceum]|uniref:Uncharacterized protein n=1 Tax=Steccherinum ochraceum TaxID=92696 RepID=A0A4R0REX7_9APHY|nr:hypothetical protein EIP91_000946 [Steccherinum ochraceum]
MRLLCFGKHGAAHGQSAGTSEPRVGGSQDYIYVLYVSSSSRIAFFRSSSTKQVGGDMGDLDYIPRELVESILDVVDRKDLAACTLLSRHWYLSAHPKLFQSIVIQENRGAVDGNAHGIAAFISSLSSSTTSPFATFVHNLNIQDTWSVSDTGGIAIADVEFILAKLPALKTLRLILVTLTPATTPIRPQTPKVLEKLTVESIFARPTQWELALDHPSEPLSTFAEFFNLFGHVKTLELGPGTIAPLSAPYPDPLDLRERYWARPADAALVSATLSEAFVVEKLIASADLDMGPSMGRALTLLAGSSKFQSSLRSLQIWDATPAVRRVLELLGHNLTDLTLRFDWEEWDREEQDPFGIALCTSLTSIRLNIWTPSTSAWGRKFVNRCLRSIVLYSTPHIKEWTIQLHRDILTRNAREAKYIRGLNWQRFDMILSSRPALQSLKFHFYCDRFSGPDPCFDDEMELIRKRIPRLVEKGVVSFTSFVKKRYEEHEMAV